MNRIDFVYSDTVSIRNEYQPLKQLQRQQISFKQKP